MALEVLRMDYTLTFYRLLPPKIIVAEGDATMSAATALIGLATLNEPMQKYKLLEVLNEDGEVYIPASDLVPYECKIAKRG